MRQDFIKKTTKQLYHKVGCKTLSWALDKSGVSEPQKHAPVREGDSKGKENCNNQISWL